MPQFQSRERRSVAAGAWAPPYLKGLHGYFDYMVGKGGGLDLPDQQTVLPATAESAIPPTEQHLRTQVEGSDQLSAKLTEDMDRAARIRSDALAIGERIAAVSSQLDTIIPDNATTMKSFATSRNTTSQELLVIS